MGSRSEQALSDDKRQHRQIRWNSWGPTRIKDMASRQALPDIRLPLVRVRGGASRSVRAPGRRGDWSPEERAHVLSSRRAEFSARLARRRDGADVPAVIRQEVVDEAITLLVMSHKPIGTEQHLEAAFWATVRLLLIEHRSGRHSVRVGSQQRVDLQAVADRLPASAGTPAEIAEARERVAQAADFMAQLDPFEQRVVSLMAIRGIGVKLAARSLGVPTKTVIAAARSADQKLEQVAVIAAAGRMCQYRRPALLADARGESNMRHAQAAKAHIAACARCRTEFSRMICEMRGREYRRRASAAFVPLPAPAHYGLFDRLIDITGSARWPTSGASDRTVGLLGGGGAAIKAAVVGTAIIATSAGVVGLAGSGDHPTRRQVATPIHRRVQPAPIASHPTPRVRAPSRPSPRSRPPRRRHDSAELHLSPEARAAVTNFPALGGNTTTRPTTVSHPDDRGAQRPTNEAEGILKTP